MTQAKAFLPHSGQFWNGIMNLIHPGQVHAADRGDGSGKGTGNPGTSDSDYDDLRNVRNLEVMDAKKIITPQLETSACAYKIQKDFICHLFLDPTLDSSTAGGPSEVYGRVIDTSPAYDPDFQYPMEFVYMKVPRKGKKATVVEVPTKIIRSYPAPTSWFMKIPVWAASSDLSDLEGYVEIFADRGIQLDIRVEPDDLRVLCVKSMRNHVSMPWLIIVTSDWLASLHPAVYEGLFDKLNLLLLKQNARIVNYHPRGGLILNDEYGYLHGVGTNYFLDSHSPSNLLNLVELEREQFLGRPL